MKDFYGAININNGGFAEDFSPIDPSCDCETCREYARGYLHHLFRVNDPLAGRLATVHNLRFFSRLMEDLRTGG